MENKIKTYYIFKVNCDCSCHLEARTNLPRGYWGGLKCRDCGEINAPGFGGWRIIDKVKARGDLDALFIYSNKKLKKNN